MPLFATLSQPSSPLLAPPSPPSLTGCVPGQAGMPDGLLGELLCGSWGPKAPTAVWDFVRARWPLILAALVVLIALVVAWRLWRRRVWRSHATQARWLHIIPPVTATPAATVGLWRLLATALPAPSRWTWRPARIVWEVEADPHGMRAGLWLPPGVNPTAVLRKPNSRGRYRFSASMKDGSNDRWKPYRLEAPELPRAVLRRLEQMEGV
jgi:hypothetical protein